MQPDLETRIRETNSAALETAALALLEDAVATKVHGDIDIEFEWLAPRLLLGEHAAGGDDAKAGETDEVGHGRITTLAARPPWRRGGPRR